MRVRAHECAECGQGFEVAIMRERQARRMFYVGSRCGCGRYSRETLSMPLVSAIALFDRVEL
jgi:hypothetical protein